MRTAERVLGGLTVIALGLIFLGSTLGFLPWSIGETFIALLSLWPVLLVTIGLDIIGRGLNSPWLRVVSSAIALVAVLYGGLVLPANQTDHSVFGGFGPGIGASKPFSFSEPRMGVDEATVVIKGGAGEIDVRAGDPATLASMSGESPLSNPSLDVQRSGSTAQVTASIGTGSIAFPLSGRARMDVRLCPEVTWDVQFETGAVAVVSDLRDIPVKAATVKTGVSSTKLTLGNVPTGAGEVPVRIESGLAAVTVEIPRDAEVRVEAQTGLSSTSVPSDMTRITSSGRTWESSGYAGASDRYLIRVQTGLGSVDIQRY